MAGQLLALMREPVRWLQNASKLLAAAIRRMHKKILIVEDDAACTNALSARLSAEGFEIIAAKDGSEAVGAIRLYQPDLVIIDVFFPPDVSHGGGVPWDGFLLVDWLRHLGLLTRTPVILVTASNPAPYMERAKASRVGGLFQKNVDPSVWIGTMHRLLGTNAPLAV